MLAGMRALLLLILLSACVDNSGGDPPPGEDVSVEAPGWESDPAACMGPEEAVLLTDEASVDAWLEECFEVGDQRQVLLDVIAGLDDSRRFVAARVQLGGCIQNWDFMGLRQDGTTIQVWVLKEDTSYGRQNVACTDDLGWGVGYWIAAEGDVADATDANLWLGTFNPDLGGAPPLPG
jgi:hypothetical protein